MAEQSKASIPDMLKKLDEMYAKQEGMKKYANKLMVEYKQLEEDIDLLQKLIMYQSNKQNRYRKYVKG